MLRPAATFPLLCAIIAFILSMLCIFAGDKPGFLEGADIMTVNTSRLGEFAFNKSSSSSSGIAGILSGIAGDIEGDIEGEVNGLIDDLAKKLNIHDFYSAHILDFCEGYYTPSPLPNASDPSPSKNVTACSKRTSLYVFDPTAILDSELNKTISLSDLQWPSAVQDAVKAVQIATKVMFICYCIGAACTATAIFGGIVGLLFWSNLTAFLNSLLDFLAFIMLLVSSAISTALATKISNAINKYGSEIGVAAYKGKVFQGFTWAATILMFVAAVVWIVDCCVGRKPGRYREKYCGSY